MVAGGDSNAGMRIAFLSFLLAIPGNSGSAQ